MIMMLEEGKIVEQGSFHELLDKKGAFFRYYSLQFGGFDVLKKILEVEYERVSRYSSKFNLAVVEALNYQDIYGECGQDFALEYMTELNLHIKRYLRKGDNAAIFYKNIIMIMLPEITEEQVFGFYSRVDKIFQEEQITLGEESFPIKLNYSAVHVQATPFKTIDDLIKVAMDGLKELEASKENYVIQTIKDKKKEGHGQKKSIKKRSTKRSSKSGAK